MSDSSPAGRLLDFIASGSQAFDVGVQAALVPGFIDSESGVYDVALQAQIDAAFVAGGSQVFPTFAHAPIPERVGLISGLTVDAEALAVLRHNAEALAVITDQQMSVKLTQEPTIQ